MLPLGDGGRVPQVGRENQIKLLGFTAFSVVTTVIALGLSDVAKERSPEWRRFCADACGDERGGGDSGLAAAGATLCRFGCDWYLTIPAVISTGNIYLTGLMLLMRVEMWSPVVELAARAFKKQWLRR